MHSARFSPGTSTGLGQAGTLRCVGRTEGVFPLQTGESAIVALGRATGILALSALFFGAAAALGIRSSAMSLALVTTPGVLLFFFSLFRLTLVAQRRASDVVLSAAGVEIVGGPRGGRRLAWSEIDAARSELIVSDEVLSTRGTVDVARLVLALAGGDTLLLAEAQTAEERASLEALLASLRSSRWRSTDPAARVAVPADAPRILDCAACGAPAEPTDADDVGCAHCGARVAVPAELRARIRAAHAAAHGSREAHADVAKLLDQPSARTVNRRLLAVAANALILGVVSLALGGPGAYVASVGVVLVVFTALVSAVGRRRAYRAVVHLGAIEPDRRGAPHMCRRCHAPLPHAAQTIVVACLHCQAANVLGLDLRREAHERACATSELRSALSLRARARAVSYVALAAGVTLTLIGAAWWRLTPPPEPAPSPTMPLVLPMPPG